MNISLSQAIDGFLLAKEVSGCSPHTIRNYRLALRRFADFLDADPPLSALTADHIRRFLHQLQSARLAPPGVAPRPARPLSAKTILNMHTTLSSLWSWALAEGYVEKHIVHAVKPPRAEKPVIEPLIQAEVERILRALPYSTPWRDRPYVRTRRSDFLRLRDRAIILFLLDTGVRASELCHLQRKDLDLKTGTAIVRGKGHRSSGQGKKRAVDFGSRTRRALWQYLTVRDAQLADGLDSGQEYVFVGKDGQPLDRRHLRTHLKRLGERAGVRHVYPHRFRHTFAINFLRNGGDIYSLQDTLGHTSLDMVRTYLRLAQADRKAAHRRASPVENWRL
jgi:integrase/recombinase XerD